MCSRHIEEGAGSSFQDKEGLYFDIPFDSVPDDLPEESPLFYCDDPDHAEAMRVLLEEAGDNMTHQDLHDTLEYDPDYLFSLI